MTLLIEKLDETFASATSGIGQEISGGSLVAGSSVGQFAIHILS